MPHIGCAGHALGRACGQTRFPGPGSVQAKALGFNNELIEVFKFRSMYCDQLDYNAAKLVTRDDPRVTRVGRFIRKTSLDECRNSSTSSSRAISRLSAPDRM